MKRASILKQEVMQERRFKASFRYRDVIEIQNKSIQRLDKYSHHETVVDKCYNLESTKRPDMNNKKTQTKLNESWCVFEYHLVLS